MEKTNIYELLFRGLAVFALLLMIAFITFGLLKGFYMEKQLRGKRRHHH